MIEGSTQTFKIAGEDVGFVFEVSQSDALVPVMQTVPSSQPQVQSNEINWGSILMGVGVIVGTIVQDIVTAGLGIADDAITISMGMSMIYGGYRGYSLYKKSNIFRQATHTAAGLTTATPLTAADDPIVIKPSEN